MKSCLKLICFVISLIFLIPSVTLAQDYTSTSFIVRDSVISVGGGRSSSSGFELFGNLGQFGIGESTTVNFRDLAGVQYFPSALSPLLRASPGNTLVNLTWTPVAATLANVTNYQVGLSTIRGGPYTYESVGNVISFTKSGLTNGKTYYFKVKAFADSLYLAESNEVSAVPQIGETCPPKADFNADCRVNIVDFSILIYWFIRPNPLARIDLNSDTRVNLQDFSIMAFYWTG